MERNTATGSPGIKSKKLWRGALLASTCISGILTALPAQAQIASNTTPTGGVVAGGSASITQVPNLTTINQTSQKTIIDWQTFNVGSAATVNFVQPSSNAVALNRVITPSPSIIAGKIDANGQLILVNQSGIVFTKGSEVDTQGLVATTSDVSDQAFLAGKLNFTGAPRPGASIINDGKITVKDTGLVGLVAPQVANNGVITAQLGQVVLAGASAFTLDLYGDRLMSIDVTQAVRAVDIGGKLVPALVTNSGLILADGGKITLTAQDADALVTQLINAGGTIRANSVGAQTGTISISGVGGNIAIAGNLLAQGTQVGTKGGAVEVLSDGTVAVQAGATINTSGDAGGGVIALGTNIIRAQRGAADTMAPRAKAVTVAPGAFLLSNATGSGDGGTITLLSADNTDFAGAIGVSGGPNGGNGGLAEISSGNVINLSGTVADTALHGRDGEILLDPATLVVGSGTTAAGSVVSGSSATFGTDSSTVSYILPSVLDTLSGTIVLEASTLVSVLSAISITGSGTALTITSGHDVSVGSSIFINGSLEIDAANSLAINGGLSATNILLNSGLAGTNINSGVTVGSGGLTLGSTGTIFEGTNGLINAGIISSAGSIGGDVSLTSAGNSIAALGSFSAAGLSLTDATALSVTGPVSLSGSATLSAASIDFAGSLSSATLSLSSLGSISESTGAITTGTLLGTASGAVALNGSANTIAAVGNFASNSGDFNLIDTRDLTIAGSLSALNTTLSSAGLAVNGSIQTGILQLASSNGVTETGQVNAAILTTGGSTIAGTVDMNTGNVIGTLNNFAATGDILLNDAVALDVAGVVFTNATLALGDTGNISQSSGAIIAAALTSDGGTIGGNVIFGQAGNNVPVLGNLGVTGNATFTDSSTINVQGVVNVGGTLGLFSTGAISQPSGTISANLFNASATSITLGDANDIVALGSIITSGTLSVNGVSGISGVVSAQNASLQSAGDFLLTGDTTINNNLTISAAGNITQPNGTVTAQNTTFAVASPTDIISLSGTDMFSGDLNFASYGSVIHGGGTLDAGTLTGTAGSLASFTALTDIGTIGSFLMGDSLFSLDNTGTLTITGPLVANVISISSTGQLILSGSPNGGMFFSGNIASNTATVPRSGVDTVLYAPSIIEHGIFYINDGINSARFNSVKFLGTTNLSATIFFLTALNPNNPGGAVGFDTGSNGLYGPSIDAVFDAGTNGNITGNVNLYHLEVINGSDANLTGTIDGISGQPASGKASATDPSSKYQINSCPIGSVDCVVLFVETLPNGNPLGDFDITERKRKKLDKNIQLPGIAMHDF